MALHLLQPTLNGGEAAPGLWHRIDLAKFSTWVKEAVNLFVRPQGGLSNRPGTVMLAQTKTLGKKVRLLPFVFSKTQAYALEVGEGYVRFFTSQGQLLDEKGLVYETITDLEEAELKDLYYCQTADVMYFARNGRRPKQLERYGHTDWKFEDYLYLYGPLKLQNSNEKMKIAACFSEADQKFYLTCENDLFKEGDIGAWWKVNHTLKSVHYQAEAATQSNVSSEPMLVTGEVTLHTSGTWKGQVKLEYTNDPKDENSWRTLREISSLSDYNANDVVSIPAGMWWVRIVTNINDGRCYFTLDCNEQEVSVFYKLTEYVSPMKVAVDLVNDTKELESYFSAGREYKSCIPVMTSAVAPSGTFSSLNTDAWHALDGKLDTYAEVPKNGNLTFSYVFPDSGVVINSISILGYGIDGNFSGSASGSDSQLITYDDSKALDIRSEERGAEVSFEAGGETRTNTYRVLHVAPVSANKITVSLNNQSATDKFLVSFVVRGYDYKAGQELTIDATAQWSEGAWSLKNGWPSCVAQHGGRLVWGQEDSAQGTQIGDNHSFATSSPLEDSDGISTTLKDEGVNAINALVSMKSLLAFTAGGVFASNAAVMTPTDAGMPKQSGIGGSSVRPVVIGTRVLYALPKSGKLYDSAYDYSTDAFDGGDLCLIAEHLFENEQIVDMCYQQEPYGLLWVVLASGKLLCLTYVAAEQVCAWTQMQTDGLVESVCCIPGEKRDELFLVVNRGGVRFVEKMADRLESKDPKEQFFVDCGRTYRGEPADVISGLDYLEGKNVAVLADGQVVSQKTVKNGSISLPFAASVVHVGLPYKARLKTLSGDLNTSSGSVLAKKKKYIGAMISFVDSRGALVGVKEGKLEKWVPEKPVSFNKAKELITEDKKFTFSADYEKMPSVTVEQRDPLPITVTAVMPFVQVGNV